MPLDRALLAAGRTQPAHQRGIKSKLTVTSWGHVEEEGREGHVMTHKRSAFFCQDGLWMGMVSIRSECARSLSSGLGRAWGWRPGWRVPSAL